MVRPVLFWLLVGTWIQATLGYYPIRVGPDQVYSDTGFQAVGNANPVLPPVSLQTDYSSRYSSGIGLSSGTPSFQHVVDPVSAPTIPAKRLDNGQYVNLLRTRPAASFSNSIPAERLDTGEVVNLTPKAAPSTLMSNDVIGYRPRPTTSFSSSIPAERLDTGEVVNLFPKSNPVYSRPVTSLSTDSVGYQPLANMDLHPIGSTYSYSVPAERLDNGQVLNLFPKTPSLFQPQPETLLSVDPVYQPRPTTLLSSDPIYRPASYSSQPSTLLSIDPVGYQPRPSSVYMEPASHPTYLMNSGVRQLYSNRNVLRTAMLETRPTVSLSSDSNSYHMIPRG